MEKFGRALDVACAATVAAACLPLGGMLPVGQAAWSLAAVTLLVLLCGWAALARSRWRWEPIAVVLAGLAALTLFRATSVGAFLAGAFEREAFGLWPELTLRGTAAPGRAPLAALRLLGVACVVQFWSIRFRTRHGTERTLRTLAWGIGAVLAVGAAHAALGWTDVYGVFRPLDMPALRTPLSAPFVNENQVGAVYALAGVLSVAVGQARVELRAGLFPLGAGLIVVTEVVFGAHGAFLAGLVAVAALAVLAPLPIARSRAYARTLWVSFLGLFALMPIVAYGVGPHLPVPVLAAKAEAWRATLGPALRRPFGYGPGAWPDAAGAHLPTSPLRVAFVESAPLQLLIDHGFVPAILLAGALGWALYRRLFMDRRGERDVRAATVAVAVFLLSEAFTGMALSATGYAFFAAALVGLVAGRSISRRRMSDARAPILGGGVVALVLSALTLPGLSASVTLGQEHAGRPLRALALSQGEASDAFGTALAEAARAVPGDIVVVSYAADRALLLGDLEAAQTRVDHLRRYAPGRLQTWQIGVDVAVARGDTDAACAAAERLAELAVDPRDLTDALTRIHEDARAWTACVSSDGAETRILEGLLLDGRSAEALALALRVLRERPDDVPALRAALVGLNALDDPSFGVTIAARLLEADPTDASSAVIGAQMHTALGDHVAALSMLDTALASSPGSVDLLLERLQALAALAIDGDARDQERFIDAYRALLAPVSADPNAAVRRLHIAGAYFRAREEWADAENAYQGVLRIRSGDVRATSALEAIRAARSGTR